MSCQPKYRVAAGLIVLLLLLPAAVGSVSPAGAAGTTTLTFLGPDFDEWIAFVKVANEIGRPMGIHLGLRLHLQYVGAGAGRGQGHSADQ